MLQSLSDAIIATHGCAGKEEPRTLQRTTPPHQAVPALKAVPDICEGAGDRFAPLDLHRASSLKGNLLPRPYTCCKKYLSSLSSAILKQWHLTASQSALKGHPSIQTMRFLFTQLGFSQAVDFG